MKYKIVFAEQSVKDLKKIDVNVKKRILDKVLKFSKSPLEHAVKLINSSLGEYRFRVGDYRVIFDVRGDTILVLRIGHRREIYR